MMDVLNVKAHLLHNVLDAKISLQLYIINIMDLTLVILVVRLGNISIHRFQTHVLLAHHNVLVVKYRQIIVLLLKVVNQVPTIIH